MSAQAPKLDSSLSTGGENGERDMGYTSYEGKMQERGGGGSVHVDVAGRSMCHGGLRKSATFTRPLDRVEDILKASGKIS